MRIKWVPNSDAPAAKPVYWGGDPQTCDLCKRPLGNSFVDGAVKPQGQWGILDLKCHRQYGVGIGLGKGQMYQRQADGRWLKTEG